MHGTWCGKDEGDARFFDLGSCFLVGREGALGTVGDILARIPGQIPVPHFFLSKEVLLAFFIR